jgi:DNA-binding LacI/PurR family transcriptional regulator
VSFDTTLHGPASTLVGIERAAHEHGYFIAVSSLAALERASLTDAVERLRRQGVEGILVITPQDAGRAAIEDFHAGVPIVAVEGGAPGALPFVGLDNHAGAELATRHLLELGHRSVQHISGPADWPEARDRADGWGSALAADGVTAPPILPGDWSPASGYRVGLELARDPELTAVFVANDQMALGLIRALHESGREVPGDVSVVGFDDIPEAEFFIPPLTTVRQDFQAIGRGSVGLLLDAMTLGVTADGSPAQHLTVEPEFVLRRSTAPSRSS